jgi:type I restriction enzyme M protein
MLDTATRRRIDTARDILVGKVPDPKSQVEQITIALIYKFMDDMDAEAEELGGRRTFFAGEFAKYGWAKLMRSGLGGHETLGLYAEAITRMPENPGVPTLFRDIFKNAYLPYRDPETLRAFLKIIDEFEYDHSERLGDAFEYLLSVLGSQGDAGQFRTPRHIIDFIVAIVDPKKGETILDPACGTSGFLISAWKHIVAANRDESGESTLTPDEQERLAANIRGYDISPDMVRLSLANMYLHGFTDPHIVEYDTLTSDERWTEFADVILANPPFMSPKGGIKPHNRFGVQSNRSEVLFVDYMAEHLTPNGRAGIIVPEGAIFQSGKAYKALRKELVERHLVAVVSLPAGVFNPYSGVKTSVLILDRAAAKASDTIGFFKVANDGFSLGAQRREIAGGELPEILVEVAQFRAHRGEQAWEGRFGRAVPKADIAANGDYNLSGERYRFGAARVARFPRVRLGEVAEVVAGQSPAGESYNENGEGLAFHQGKTEFGQVHLGAPRKWTTSPTKLAQTGDILMSVRAPVGPVNIAPYPLCIGRGLAAIRAREASLLPLFAFYFLRSIEDQITGSAGAAFAAINRDEIKAIEIPLPPLELQREIVTEIEGHQKVIDGARAVVENYRPHVARDPGWPTEEIGTVCKLYQPETITQADLKPEGPYLVFGANGIIGRYDRYNHEDSEVLVTCRGATCGTVNVSAPKSWVTGNAMVVQPRCESLSKEFLAYLLRGSDLQSAISGSAQPQITRQGFAPFIVPVPPRDVQDEVVAELEAERALVDANRDLIARMEKKIEAAIARVWGAATSGAAEPEKIAAE